MSSILRISTTSENEADAISEISQKMGSKTENDFSVLFFSSQYDPQKMKKELASQLGKNVIGCSTAGEISERGYEEKSISAVTFKGEKFLFEEFLISNVSQINEKGLSAAVKTAKQNEIKLGPNAKSFCMILIDGLSIREEVVTALVGNGLEGIPLVGGSAGDGLNFNKTFIYAQNEMHENAAILLFITTTTPFEIFKIQHFEETDQDLVITDSVPEKRIVTEINGEPAAVAYSELLNLEISKFTPQVFSHYPLMLKIGGEYYVRSIQKVNEDGSLTFYCAIDNGLVLTLAKPKDLLPHTEKFFQQVEKKLGTPSCSLLFECILRRLEVVGLAEEERQKVSKLYRDNSAIGFHTYGEQYGTVHINQTLTGVIFGKE